MQHQYIVLCPQAYCNPGARTSIEHATDGKRFAERADAIKHGFTLGRSDDFNIGVLRDGRLISLDWMETVVSDKAHELADIAEQILLRTHNRAA